MKSVIALLVIVSSFLTASANPGNKRHVKKGDEVTLPCCENVEVIECSWGVPWKVFMALLILFLLLLMLGCIKGLLGFCCPFISLWGLGVMTGQGQPLVCCYESQFAGHPVICDCLPNKSHATTHTTHMYSRTTEFCLNLIFFLAYPFALCCKCCQCHEKDEDKGMCISGCDPEKCYGSQLEEEDVKFVLEQLKLSRDSFKRCMCDAAEQTPLLKESNEKGIQETDNPAFETNNRQHAHPNTTSEMEQTILENDEYIPSHSDLSSNDVDQYELLEARQMQQQQQLLMQ